MTIISNRNTTLIRHNPRREHLEWYINHMDMAHTHIHIHTQTITHLLHTYATRDVSVIGAQAISEFMYHTYAQPLKH